MKRNRSLKIITTAIPPFTPKETSKVIDAVKPSKATGPDNISNINLKHLGPKGVGALTSIFKHSWLHNAIPYIWKQANIAIPYVWKQANITPILKGNKPLDQPASYRPISLLSCVSKIMERLMLARVSPSMCLAEHQHGFRSKRSTTTYLTKLTPLIADGFNSPVPPKRPPQ